MRELETASRRERQKYLFKNLAKAADSTLNFWADHPAFIFQVVGQSRDDVLTAVQAGGYHPGSQLLPPQINNTATGILLAADCFARLRCGLGASQRRGACIMPESVPRPTSPRGTEWRMRRNQGSS
jgi:hypothetical protein